MTLTGQKWMGGSSLNTDIMVGITSIIGKGNASAFIGVHEEKGRLFKNMYFNEKVRTELFCIKGN